MEHKDAATAPTSIESIEEFQEELLSGIHSLKEGSIVEGTVVLVSDNEVFVDIGYKADGRLPLKEFSEPIEIGQKVNVMIFKRDPHNGGFLVSFRKAREKIQWEKVKEAFNNSLPINGTVIRVLENSFEVSLDGLMAYVAFSKMDVKKIADANAYINQTYEFLVERIFREKGGIKLSRRAYLEREIDQKRDEFFKTQKVGNIVEGVVKNFVSFGAFIDLGGFDGLLHLNEISWGHNAKPKSFLKKGKKTKFSIVQLDPELKKVSLSLRELTPDPLLTFEEKFALNQIVDGVVTNIVDFGAFVKIEEGIEGLVHLSELSWARSVRDPRDVLTVGQEVEVAILDYDLGAKKISLSLKRTTSDPWDTVNETYPVGTSLTRPVVKITKTGIFVRLDESFDAFIHAEHVSWIKRAHNLHEMFKVGEEIKFIIIEVDPLNRHIRAGVKELLENPWDQFVKEYQVGTIVDGTIVRISEHGLIVKVPFDIEGLVHHSELTQDGNNENTESLLQRYKVGDDIRVVLKDINKKRSRLGLSVRDVKQKESEMHLKKFLHDETTDNTVSLCDFMK